MPELPEVETVRDGLARHVLGRQVTGVEVRRHSSVRRHDGGPDDFVGRLAGRRLAAAVRRGKYLWLLLDDAGSGEALLAHLGMSGQLLVRHPGSGPDHPHLRARLHLAPAAPSPGRAVSATPSPGPTPLGPAGAEGPVLLDFIDQRTFGHLSVTDLVPTADGGPGGHGSLLAALPTPVAHIARDPLDPALDETALVAALRRRRTQVKRALLDQTLVSGIGNIYADESLWRAGLHGDRPTAALRPAQAGVLLGAVREVLSEALAAGGTSFDALYVGVDGAPGYFERSLAVYGRAGVPCPRCGGPVRRESFMNRSSYFCRRCQPPPRRRTASVA